MSRMTLKDFLHKALNNVILFFEAGGSLGVAP